MTVSLIRPTTSSCGAWRGEMPIAAARRYVRGPGNSRWHRPRAGVQHTTGRVTLDLWCGPFVSDAPGVDRLLYADTVPADEPVCGTCEGRALGAGQDASPDGLPDLIFSPRWQAPPRLCPGSRSRTLWDPAGHSHSAGRCLACGDLVAVRAIGRGYSAYGAGPVNHAPGPELVQPCPFHAWHRLVRRESSLMCACGWPYELTAVAS